MVCVQSNRETTVCSLLSEQRGGRLSPHFGRIRNSLLGGYSSHSYCHILFVQTRFEISKGKGMNSSVMSPSRASADEFPIILT